MMFAAGGRPVVTERPAGPWLGTSPTAAGFNLGRVTGCGPASHVDLAGGIAIVVLVRATVRGFSPRIGVPGRPSTARVTRWAGPAMAVIPVEFLSSAYRHGRAPCRKIGATR